MSSIRCRSPTQPAVKADLHAIMKAKTVPQARSAARRFADRWQVDYPKAVACLRDDFDELLTCWCYKSLAERKQVRTTNAIERRFREVRRRTRPMGVFSDRTLDGSHPLRRVQPTKTKTKASAPLSC